MAFGNLLAVVFNKTARAMCSTRSPSIAPRIGHDRQLRSLRRVRRIRGAGSRFHRVPHCLPKSCPPAFETVPPLLPRFGAVMCRLFAVPEVGAARLAANEACCGVCHTQGDFVSLAPAPHQCSWWHGLEMLSILSPAWNVWGLSL